MLADLEIVEATPEIAREIFANLSKAGTRDLEYSGTNPEDFDKEIAVSAIAHVAYWKGKPAAMWGVRPNSMFLEYGYLWLVTTKVVEEYPFQFIRIGRKLVKGLLRLFPVLHGIVLPHQEQNTGWLKLIGFDVDQYVEIDRTLYRRFVMRRA